MPENRKSTSRSLTGIAGIVAFATLISKVFGLVREQAVAAAFGVGAVANAYVYANIIPGFLFILLGGINGPFHSSIVSVLAKREKSAAAPLLETVTTLVSGVLLVVTILLILFAPTFIDLVAPGLDEPVRAIAIQQLRIMAPMALLAGLIGIGFGILNASEQYWLPSLSPIFSSLAIIAGLGILYGLFGAQIDARQYAPVGGIVLAGGTLAGAVVQWLAQLVAQWRSGLGKLRLRFDWRIDGLKEVMSVMVPAIFSAGMLHINVYTDLFFASYIDHAAAAMKYASLIVLTPLGIISNMILVPMLPVFSQLAAPENWQELKVRIRQGLLLTALTMLPLTAIFIASASLIVRLVYQRFAFNEQAVEIVVPVLVAYGLGMFFYLGRDVLVRVFYALGDGNTPFRVSVANIFLNLLLDFLLVNAFATPGLVLATIGVNLTSMAVLLWVLHRRLNGLPLLNWGGAILALTGSSFVAGLGSWAVSWGWEQIVDSENLLFQLLEFTLAALVAVGIFALFASRLNLPEVEIVVSRIRQRFSR